MKPIVTEYADTRFRSRLEARWAAFFNLVGWRWEYEPPEQKGWIPDFALIGIKQIIKVEVKPIEWCGDGDDLLKQANSISDIGNVRRIIDLQHNNAEEIPNCDDILLLGAYPHLLNQSWGEIALGVFILENWGDSDVACLAGGYPPRLLDFHALMGSYRYRMGGEYDGDGHIRHCNIDAIEQKWRQAGNAVQWKA